MKLSEAILLGSIRRPQAFNVLFNGFGSCAWGGAYEATGHALEDIEHKLTDLDVHCIDFKEGWGWAKQGHRQCPLCANQDSPEFIIHHLNDYHHLTRPQIAAWVATIEPVELEQPTIETKEYAYEAQ